MATLINADNLSDGWLDAVQFLRKSGRKVVHLSVAINRPGCEDSDIRRMLDAALAIGKKQSVSTVANTVFPDALYLPERLREKARDHFYENVRLLSSVAKRHKSNVYGRYIDRLITWQGTTRQVNQLELTVQRLRSELGNGNTKSSRYEIGIVSPDDFVCPGSDLRIQQPDYDTRTMGFPCLSHISLTVVDRKLNLTALYRNQYFFQKAYGNYLGLSRLMRFFCIEADCEMGELLCIATHADLEAGYQDLDKLLETYRGNRGLN